MNNKCKQMVLRLFWMCFCVWLCVFPAMASEEVGKVLYHQDFSVVSSASIAGVEAGENTLGGEVAVRNHALAVRAHDAYRVYGILTDFGSLPATYTLETLFRFDPRDEGNVENGYFSILVSCTGEAYENVIGFRIRINGDVEIENSNQQKEVIGVLSAPILEKMQAGESVHVSVPVKNNNIRGILFTVGEDVCRIHRNEDLEIEKIGRLGFCVRNAYVSVEEVWVVNGTGYTEKTGEFADKSYVSDGNMGEPDLPYAPPTGDILWIWSLLVGTSAAMVIVGKNIKNKIR